MKPFKAFPLSALGLAIAIAGCRHPAPPPDPGPGLPVVPVDLVPVESGGLVATESVTGTVRARLRAAVEAKLQGRIEALLVVPGQSVQAGEVLVVLDAREVQARLDSATAVAHQAARDLERIQRLVTDGAATAAEREAIEARHRVALAGVAEVNALLGHARVTAPFAGVITRKLADVGDLATPGRPLVEIEDPSGLRFEADVPEALVDRVRIGDRFPVETGTPPHQLEATVGEISPVAEAITRTYRVKMDLPHAPGLRAGQFGRVAIPTGESAVPHIPASALLRRGQVESVFTAGHPAGVRTGPERVARLRLVRTGKPLGDRIEIVAGLDPGEQVVLQPAGLMDGQPLEVRR